LAGLDEGIRALDDKLRAFEAHEGGRPALSLVPWEAGEGGDGCGQHERREKRGPVHDGKMQTIWQ